MWHDFFTIKTEEYDVNMRHQPQHYEQGAVIIFKT